MRPKSGSVDTTIAPRSSADAAIQRSLSVNPSFARLKSRRFARSRGPKCFSRQWLFRRATRVTISATRSPDARRLQDLSVYEPPCLHPSLVRLLRIYPAERGIDENLIFPRRPAERPPLVADLSAGPPIRAHPGQFSTRHLPPHSFGTVGALSPLPRELRESYLEETAPKQTEEWSMQRPWKMACRSHEWIFARKRLKRLDQMIGDW